MADLHIPLRGEAFTADPRLDRVYELDLRSLNHLIGPRLNTIAPAVQRWPRSYTHRLTLWLDQGAEGACVGFGYGQDLASTPAVVGGVNNSYARLLYHLIQREDPWPGGSYVGAEPFYEGTSVLTGAKVLTGLGYYKSYDWGLNARDVAEGIAFSGGPAIMGLDWFEGMFNTDSEGFIKPTGDVMGGHCILAVGVKIVWKTWVNIASSRNWDNVDYERSYILLHNSWGPSWGIAGRAKLSLADLDLLMGRLGEACFPKRNSKVKQVIGV